MNGSGRPAVCLSHLFCYVPIIVMSIQQVKVRGRRLRSQRSKPNVAVSAPDLKLEFTYDDEMIHKACCCLGEVPYRYSKSSLKCQGHTAKNISILTKIWCFRTVAPIWTHRWLWTDAQSLKQHRRDSLLFFKAGRQIFRSRRTKNRRFWPELSVSGLHLKFEFPDDFEMMTKAWSSIEEVPNCFPRSSITFQGHTRQKVVNSYPNWVFLDRRRSQ